MSAESYRNSVNTMSVPRALSILDSHVCRSGGEGTLHTQRSGTNGEGGTQGRRTCGRRGTGRSVPAVLPAFQVGRRDGPSPYDPHKGDAQVGIDRVMASRLDVIAVVAAGEEDGAFADDRVVETRELADRVAAGSSLEAAVLGEKGREEGRSCTLQTDYFKITTHVPALFVSPPAACDGAVEVTGPWAVRERLKQDVAEQEANLYLTKRAREQGALYGSCVRRHPHGVLGIRESPYGPETGRLYAEHGRTMGAQHAHQARKLLGYTRYNGEAHLLGSVQVRDDGGPERLHVAYNAPPDNIFGGVNVDLE